MQQGNRKAIYAAIVANFGIAVAKFVAYIATGASSMLAEGVHSVADTGNQALLLWGGAAAKRPPTKEHPFGYGRERYFWGFVVSLVLFSLGSLFALYEGIHKISHPRELSNLSWAIGVLLLGIVLEGFSFRTAVVESLAVKGDESWWSFVRHSKSPELPVVLLEDFGALLGLTIALGGIGLAVVTGDARYDAGGSILIGVLLGVIAVVLAVEMKSLLMGEAASPEDQRRILLAIGEIAVMHRVIHMRTQHIGPDQMMVAAKLEFDGGLSFRELSDAIDDVESAIRAALPSAHIVYIEPDIYDPGEDTRLRAPAESTG